MCRLFLVTVALLLIAFGLSGLWMMPRLIQQKIEQTVQLKIGTKTFQRFTKVPIPLTVKIYLFNVTNSEAVLERAETPHFQEVGPFMFKQWRRRDVLDFEDYNRRIRYRETKTFYHMFRPGEPSAGMLDPWNTKLTLLNLPLLSVLSKLSELEEGSVKRSLAAKIAGRLIEDGRDKILVTKPANELLFDGYTVDFMESARELVSDTFGYNFESPLPRNKFGFFYNKNATWNRREAGELSVFTGRNDSMRDFMQVDSWNDQHELNVWPRDTEAGNRCNQIRGTDGSQFHPGVTRQQRLAIFSPMICTSIHIEYREDTEARGIPLLRFGTPASLFGAPRRHPQNACYCTRRQAPSTAQHPRQPINDSRCYRDGLLDLSLCQQGAPVAASSPHFYNADPMLALAAGLSPRKELHETYIDIEPMTGAVFRAASRAQINAFVEPAALEVVDSAVIGHMTPMVAPLLWLEEAAEIDDKSAREFKARLLDTVHRAHRSFLYALAGGLLLVLAVATQYWYATCRAPAKAGERRIGGNARSSNSGAKATAKRRPRAVYRGQEEGLSERMLVGAASSSSADSSPRQSRASGEPDQEDDLTRPGTSSAASP